ncbi:MAG: DUF1223 domain-containing protein [Burkholderiales bacterium]|nr:DUF1223 domain-containing protein [Burkholderiales bacterium]
MNSSRLDSLAAFLPGMTLATAAALATAPVLAGEACMARSGATSAPVVELYTSEGCNSCPPADRWLSKLKSDPSVVALAFHVDYWDRLGWKDRFASAAFTSRQAEQQASNGARFSYTPQVVVDGQDRKDWPGIATPIGKRAASPVDVVLTRDGDRVTASVAATSRAPKRLAAYWAVTEQGHVSAVKAGENRGVTLEHDYVVRDYKTVPAWTASTTAPQTVAFQLPAQTDATPHPRAVNLVVVDADTGRPVQAVKIGC